MKFIIFSDIHIHDYKTHSTRDRSRLEVGIALLKTIWKYADDHGISRILFVGDLYDMQKLLPTAVVNRMIETFLELAATYPKIKCWAISGNHDHSSKNLLHKSAITALTHIADVVPNNFVLMDDVTELINGGHNEDPVILSGVPYYEYPEHFQQRLSVANFQSDIIGANYGEFKPFRILLVHQTPTGLENKNIPFDTDVHDPLYDIFDEVFCGHIHARQEITPKFTIVGSPMHRDMDDAGVEKGFYVLDTFTREKEWVSLKGNYPEFIVVRVKLGEDIPIDPHNFIVPVIVDGIRLPKEGEADPQDFQTDLSPATLVANYCATIAPDDQQLLTIGLECLTLKQEE